MPQSEVSTLNVIVEMNYTNAVQKRNFKGPFYYDTESWLYKFMTHKKQSNQYMNQYIQPIDNDDLSHTARKREAENEKKRLCFLYKFLKVIFFNAEADAKSQQCCRSLGKCLYMYGNIKTDK